MDRPCGRGFSPDIVATPIPLSRLKPLPQAAPTPQPSSCLARFCGRGFSPDIVATPTALSRLKPLPQAALSSDTKN